MANEKVTKHMEKHEYDKREQAQTAYIKAPSVNTIYENIVNALSRDYFDLFYVNVETDEYVEYGSRSERDQQMTERHGINFFEECSKNAPSIIFENDLERVTTALTKERLIKEVRKHGTYIYHYRLLIDGVPTYVSMKATCIPGDDKHIIMGVSNVDSQVKDRIAAERATEDQKAYLRLSALVGNLIVLYYVDPASNEYTEFSASAGYEGLGLAKLGSDFFKDSYENSLSIIHPEDQPLFHAQVTKENILATIEKNGVFSVGYRLVSSDLPTHVRLKAAMVDEDGKAMLLVGLLDEDAHFKQEQEHESSPF